MFQDNEMSFQDWQGIMLASLEVGGQYEAFMKDAIQWLKSLAHQKPLSLPLDELNVPIFFEIALPKIINQVLNFGYVSSKEDIDLIKCFLKRVIKIIPMSIQYLNSDLINSISNIFYSMNLFYQSNKMYDLHKEIVSRYFDNQDNILYELIELRTFDDSNAFINFFILLISINMNNINYTKKERNNTLAAIFTQSFIDFLELKSDDPTFFTEFFNNLTSAFDILSKFLIVLDSDVDLTNINRLIQFSQQNLSNPNIKVQKFAAHCLSTLCSNPKQAQIILKEQSESTNSVFDNLISSNIQPETLKELQPFIQLQIEHGIINLKSLIQFWYSCNDSEVLFNNQVCIDLISFSLKYLDIDSIYEFLSAIQINLSSFYYNVLSKTIYELQNSERTIEISISQLQTLLSLAIVDEYARKTLLNLIKMKLNVEISCALINETLPLFQSDEEKNVELAFLIIKEIIESSSDPNHLLNSCDLNSETLYKIINDKNRVQIINLIFLCNIKVGSKPNSKIIKDLLNSDSREETFLFLKKLIKNKNYQNSEDLKELYQIANKEDLQIASRLYYKFLKSLILKLNNNSFIEANGMIPVTNHHLPFKIKSSTIRGLDLMLNLYQINNNTKTVTSAKKFLLLLFKNWETNSSVEYLNEQIQQLILELQSNPLSDDKEPLIRSLDLVFDYITQIEINSDPEDLNTPRHFYPRNYLILQIYINSIYTKKNYSIHFDQQKTLKNLKERIAERENQNTNSIILENYQSNQENLSLFENGIINNSQINIKINTYSELSQTHLHYQTSPSYLFYNIQFGDVLLNLMDENNEKVNSSIWRILQLLPTAKSVTDIFIKNEQNDQDDDLIVENFLSQFLKTENDYKKLYFIQSLSKSDVNVFSHSSLLTTFYELFDNHFFRDDIIYLFNSRYNEEYFQFAENFILTLIQTIPKLNNDDLITTIFELINRIAKENDFCYLKESFEIFQTMNHSFWQNIANFIRIVNKKVKCGDDVYNFCEPNITNFSPNQEFSQKTQFSLFLISRLIDELEISQANTIYQRLIGFVIYFIENDNDFNSNRILTEILECIVSILNKYSMLVELVQLPSLSLFKFAFGKQYNTTQKSIFSILTTFMNEVKDSELPSTIVPIMTEMINYPLERWNYDPSYFQRKAPYTGLRNLGATCFVNSIFQQFFHLFPVRYFISTYEFKENEEIKTLQDLFIRMNFTSRSFADTSKFISTWHGRNKSLLNPKEQQDSVEFFLDLINALPSKITDMFKGEMKNFLSGIGVKYDNSSTEAFFYLNISIKNHKDIDSSLHEFVQDDQLSDYECDMNKQKITVNKFIRISKLPPILVIQLSRFEYSLTTNDRYKINDRFEFPLSLNIKNLCENQEDDDSSFMYNLSGIVVHTGVANAGHYISNIRKGEEWWTFNDIEVSKVNEKDVLNNAFGGKESNSSAYVLFYTKNDYSLIEENHDHIITFDNEFDYSNEVEGLEEIFKDNEIFEKSQALFGSPVIDFIQNFKEPILNLSFFIRVLCHSLNYSKANQFATNLFKMIQNQDDLIKCAEYLIDHLVDIIDDYMNCLQEVSILNLTEIIKTIFINLDKTTFSDEDSKIVKPHKLSLTFFDKFADNVANRAHSYRQLPAMLNLIKNYISNYPLDAYKNGWVKKLLTILEVAYNSQISRNQNILSNLNLSDLFITLNTILSNVPELDSDISSDLLKHAIDIKLSEANREVYSQLLMTGIVKHNFNITQVKSLVQINFETIKSKVFESLKETILNPEKEMIPDALKKQQQEEDEETIIDDSSSTTSSSCPSVFVTVANADDNKNEQTEENQEQQQETEELKHETEELKHEQVLDDSNGAVVMEFDTKLMEIEFIKEKVKNLITRNYFTDYELAMKLTDEIKKANIDLIKKIVYYSPYIFADKITSDSSTICQSYFNFYKVLFDTIEKNKDVDNKDQLMTSLLNSFDDYITTSVHDSRIQEFISKNSFTTSSNYTKLYSILMNYTKDYQPERAENIIRIVKIIDKTKRVFNDQTIMGLMSILVSFPRESLKGKLNDIIVDFFLERISTARSEQVQREIDPIIKIISNFLSIDIQMDKAIQLDENDELLNEVYEVFENESLKSFSIKYITNTLQTTTAANNAASHYSNNFSYSYTSSQAISENSRKLFKFYLLLGKKLDKMNESVEKMVIEAIEKFDQNKYSFEIKIKFFNIVAEINTNIIDKSMICYYFNEFIKIFSKPSLNLGNTDLDCFRKFIDTIATLNEDENFDGIELSTKFFASLASKYQVGVSDLIKKVLRWLYHHTSFTRENIVDILTEIIKQKNFSSQNSHYNIAFQYCFEKKDVDLLLYFYDIALKNNEKDKALVGLQNIFNNKSGILVFKANNNNKDVDEDKCTDWMFPFVKIALESLDKKYNDNNTFDSILKNMSDDKKLDLLLDAENKYFTTNSVDVKNTISQILLFLIRKCSKELILLYRSKTKFTKEMIQEKNMQPSVKFYINPFLKLVFND